MLSTLCITVSVVLKESERNFKYSELNFVDITTKHYTSHTLDLTSAYPYICSFGAKLIDNTKQSNKSTELAIVEEG